MARLWGCPPDEIRRQSLADYGEMVRLLNTELKARQDAARKRR